MSAIEDNNLRPKHSLSLLIPALNEEGAIESTIDAAQALQLDRLVNDFEIIVIDDGSTDSTGDKASRKGTRVIKHLQNLGYGRSLKDGIRAASFDMIAICDADGSYPLQDLPKLIAEYNRGYNMVVGQRRGAHYKESWLKMPLRRFLRFLVEYTSGQKIPDVNSGLRVFSKSEALPYFNQLCNTFSFTTSITLGYLLTGKILQYVPIDYNERIGKSHVRLFKDSMRTLQYILQAALYHNPLKIFLLLCGCNIALSFVSFFFGFIFQIKSAFLIGAGAIVCSLLVFAIGLLSDQLRQISLKLGAPSGEADGRVIDVGQDVAEQAEHSLRVVNK